MADQPAIAADRRKDRKHADDDAVASRRLEALHAANSEEVLSALLDAANGRKIESRRGALLALGELDGALEPLMTAYEGEKDALARGFALLSIGRLGGASHLGGAAAGRLGDAPDRRSKARAFLVRELERGPASVRPWCALALGVLAGEGGDAEACEVLRAGYEREKVRSSRGAYLLALGIARDGEAEALLRDALLAKDAPTRAYAAQGLGLLVTAGSRGALRAALVAEETPLVRTAVAQALALQGDPRDVEMLLNELDRARSPLLRGQIAAALGFHGSREAIAGLLERLERDTLQGESRAAALGALAIGLSGRDSIALGEASAWSNHAVFPGWLQEMLQQPL
jgi:HEAT repeat protein